MSSIQRALASVTQLVAAVSDHVSGADIVHRDLATTETANARMAARLDSLRAGFSAICERHATLAGKMGARRQ